MADIQITGGSMAEISDGNTVQIRTDVWLALLEEINQLKQNVTSLEIYAEHTHTAFCEVSEECDRLTAEAARLRAALQEARIQIAYLHEKFTATGSGNQVLARIDAALDGGKEVG